MICLERFSDPQVLSCEHTFCKQCVTRLTRADVIRCPKCRQTTRRRDVRPDARLATFQDALARRAEELIHDAEQRAAAHDVTPPTSDRCELCDDNGIAAYCHQCEQWMCAACRKPHSKAKATRRHTYVTQAEHTQRIRNELTSQSTSLTELLAKSTRAIASHDDAIAEIRVTRVQSLRSSNTLRQALHDEIDAYFDTFNARTTSFCDTCSAMCAERKHDLATTADELSLLGDTIPDVIQANDDQEETSPDTSDMLIDGDRLLTKMKTLVNKLSDQLEKPLVVPQVHLERARGWSLDNALDSQHKSVKRFFSNNDS